MEFIATCPAGFEQLLADELRQLETPQVRPLRGQVAFEGPLRCAYRVCLWSRLASRVVAVLARIDAHDADALYEGVAGIAWEEQLARDATFAIDAHGTNAQLRNTQFTALRSKDALTDRLLARRGARPVADPARPDLTVAVRLSRERAMVGIDLAGSPLFRRGYEVARGKGDLHALRADYAAALLAAGSWTAGERRTLVVPFSGAGTIAAEAASWTLDRAPGLLRQRWGFEGWDLQEPDEWSSLVHEAHERAQTTHDTFALHASDTRMGAEVACRQALRAAGIDLKPQFFAAGEAPRIAGEPTLLAADLSWIEADAVAVEAAALEQLAASASALDAGAQVVALTADAVVDDVLGTPESVTETIVGRNETSLRRWLLDGPPTRQLVSLPQGGNVGVLLPTSEQFARRLAKAWRLRRKWARREDVSCYRIYDADLPDYAVSIDLFEGSETPGRWLQIYEYAPPASIDATRAQARLLDVLALAPRLLDVRPENTFVRVRTKAKGGSQYADEARPQRDGARAGRRRDGTPALPPGAHLVDEGGLTFEVNFRTRLDCGIFLDHRDTRAMLREMAKQTKGSKRFLNLFAYTGTATCYAADGGAKHTTTVDLSRPSLDWARRNMERNGFTGREHEFVQADVIRWVSEQRRTANRWDLVFCDVPTFSNSRRMGRGSFDVQRDHAELLIGISRLLTRDGVCVFSCNLRSFAIDEAALAKAGVVVEDITAQTIPEDFARTPRIHRCYLVRRAPRTGA